MARSVSPNDYDWFTPADLRKVIDAIHTLHEWRRVVLVGGQSLTAWVQYYGIELPPFEGPYLTADADFLATRIEATVIARALGSEAKIPSVDDHTPNAAAIDFCGAGGKPLHIDILTGVLGLESAQVRKLAVPIAIGDYQAVCVLHPLLVLESRCVNLERLSEKRHGNGITQARVACTVAKRYLQECLSDESRRREALKAAARISTLARSGAGVFVWREWQIDVLEVIDPAAMPGDFSRSWQYDLRRIAHKREVASRPKKKRAAAQDAGGHARKAPGRGKFKALTTRKR